MVVCNRYTIAFIFVHSPFIFVYGGPRPPILLFEGVPPPKSLFLRSFVLLEFILFLCLNLDGKGVIFGVGGDATFVLE